MPLGTAPSPPLQTYHSHSFMLQQGQTSWPHCAISCLCPFTHAVLFDRNIHPPTNPYSRQTYWSGLPFPTPGDLPNPGIKPWSPALQVDSFLSEPPGKPRNPGVGSLFLLQGIFLTQESNQGLLHCRQILYQLSHKGSPVERVKRTPQETETWGLQDTVP